MTLQFEGVGFGAGPGSGGKIGTVALVAMGSEPSTPYTVGSRWFYNGKIYTATSTTTTDGGVVPSYNTAYLYDGTYYYWDGSTLQGADESNLVHISGAETITGNKTFSGTNNLGDATSATTQPTSDTSDKVATTKFVKDFAEDGEWQKPSDWVDIRSGALDNSVYFLVAHSKPVESGGVYSIASYPKFAVLAQVSTSANTYDVFVDGIKVATTAHNTKTEIDWTALYNNGTFISGYDVIHPSELTTHVVRITPSVSTDTLKKIESSEITGQTQQGILWTHFQLDYIINIRRLLAGTSIIVNVLCEAVTAKNDTIKFDNDTSTSAYHGLYESFLGATSLKKLPVLEVSSDTNAVSAYKAFDNVPVKRIEIKNNSQKTTISSFVHNFKGEEIDIENPVMLQSGTGTANNASGATNLKKLPSISTTEKSETLIMSRLDSIEETFIDESFNDQRTLLRIDGASGHQTNLIGLVVSPNAPFNYATAPQLSVNYTNMTRSALVNLFKSLPYNVGYTQPEGSNVNIVDGVASGFSENDYLQTQKNIPLGSDDFEINVAFIANEIKLMGAFNNNNYWINGFYLTANGKIHLTYHQSSPEAKYYNIESSISYVAGTKYYVKIKRVGTKLSLFVSTDKNNWTEDYITLDNGCVMSEAAGRFGALSTSAPNPLNGSIYLNETNIIIKNIIWFRGTAAMTKTISVIGCTGTPDLTADDKAIAEDKGWSIALS